MSLLFAVTAYRSYATYKYAAGASPSGAPFMPKGAITKLKVAYRAF